MQQDKVTFYIQEAILKKLPEEFRDKVCIAGGAIRDKLLGEDIKDFDMFVESAITEERLLAWLDAKAKPGHKNAQLANYTFEGKWLQVIRGKYFNMQTTETIDNFDFVHCCAMVTMQGFKSHPDFYRACATKHLMVNKLLYPLNSLERMTKYIKKGYTPCNGTLMALTKAIQGVDLTKSDQNLLEFYADGSPRFLGMD